MATLKEIKELREKTKADIKTCNKYLQMTNGNVTAAYAKMKHDKLLLDRISSVN